jgi:CDP-glycerol glycerophosphotransferase (TagB/SpsB family)
VLIPVDDYTILPYLYAADALISEASSTMFDFVALDKIGIILYCRARPCSITMVRRCSTRLHSTF